MFSIVMQIELVVVVVVVVVVATNFVAVIHLNTPNHSFVS